MGLKFTLVYFLTVILNSVMQTLALVANYGCVIYPQNKAL